MYFFLEYKTGQGATVDFYLAEGSNPTESKGSDSSATTCQIGSGGLGNSPGPGFGQHRERGSTEEEVTDFHCDYSYNSIRYLVPYVKL